MTRRTGLAGLATASIALAVLCGGSGRAAADTLNFAPPPPADLEVSGGEDRWHPGSDFRLDWTLPDPSWSPPIAAVHFRVLSAARAEVIPDTRIGWAASTVEGVHVPAPGAYTAEVWLESQIGGRGPSATAKLRFDDVRPGPVEPLATPRWIGRAALPLLLRLSHPAEPLPQSGIRGYAVSVDTSPAGDPCAAADRCTEAETDLLGGIAEDSASLWEPPEGASYVHAVAVSGSGMKSGVTESAVVHVDTTDPVTTLTGVPVGWANHPALLRAMAADAMSGMDPAGAEGPFTAIRIDGSVPATAAGETVGATVIAEGEHTIAYYARDGAGNVNDGAAGNKAPSTAIVRIDRSPPSASFADAQRPDDPESIEVRLSDSLSGPDLSRGRVAVRRRGSGESFELLPTGAGEGGLKAHWDSDAYPAGEYEFRATGYDSAGNYVTTYRRADGALMVLPNPLKVPTGLEAGFATKKLGRRRCETHRSRRRCRREASDGFERLPTTRIVADGKSVLIAGRLVADLALPLARVPVRIAETFDPGTRLPDRVTTVQTGADGVFVARLAPGPSRYVTAAFEGTKTLTRSDDAPVRLGVRAEVRLRSSAPVARVGGRPIVFAGKVGTGAAAIPAEGKTVQLQFRFPGLPWAEFRTVQTDAGGRFRYRYRFADDDSRGVRFEFRAFVPAQEGWPYEAAGSRPVAVTGR